MKNNASHLSQSKKTVKDIQGFQPNNVQRMKKKESQRSCLKLRSVVLFSSVDTGYRQTDYL